MESETATLTNCNRKAPLKIASWNCAGAFREKVHRALDLDADVYVIQEAEAPAKYAALFPAGTSLHYVVRPKYPKGLLVFARPGFVLAAKADASEPEYAHIVPLSVTSPGAKTVDIWAVWTLDASPPVRPPTSGKRTSHSMPWKVAFVAEQS